ncbi:MAG: NAD(P)H-dependent oxidoreductase subunit E [Cyclobacteriaceae bacterium]|nr:NAD(P)H-dependent oxidoreductase subunit E [Cyclobacteriaceae bacterium]
MYSHPESLFFSIEPSRSQLLNRLWETQEKHRLIGKQHIDSLAHELDISSVEVEGVSTFYHFFHNENAGKHSIYLNNSILSELRGYDRIKEAFEHETGAPMGSVDRTGTFGLFSTPCIGLSDFEPSALIDFYPFINLNALRVKEIIQKIRQGASPAEICDAIPSNVRYTPSNDQSIFFAPYKPGAALHSLAKLGPEGVIEQLKLSQLSGRGGAFYPTWQKWNACRGYQSDTKFIVCNADEGEPGTFKDRVLLQAQPGSVFEGMIVAGYAVGASYGILYLRGEYRWMLKDLTRELEQFRALGLLGTNVGGISGFNFDIRIQLGAGAYVCGEETALLESLEGKRGEPRTKWFFPVQKGYLQQPTVVNNVETFAAAARLIEMGADSYLRRGIPGSPGTKLISISGDCRKPGVYEIEYGMSVAELLELCEADDPYFIQVSGPSGESISIAEKYRRISMLDLMSHKDIRCGGSFMVFNHHRDIVKILLNFSEFFKHESCGVCTPCRAGNFIIQRKLERLQNALADHSDVEDLAKWGALMKATSRCGLGKTATNAVQFALQKFPEYFAHRFAPEDGTTRHFDLESAVSDYEKYKS